MPLFGLRSSKRTRSSRAAAIGASSTVAGRIDEVIHDRSVVLRLMIVAAAILGMLAAVEGWKTSFTHRLGDHPSRGILAKIDFSRVSRLKTQQAQADRVAAVPYYFQNDVEPLRSLPVKLRGNLEELIRAATLAEVSEECRRYFGLIAVGTSADETEVSDEVIAKRFDELRSSFAQEPSIGPDGQNVIVDVTLNPRIDEFVKQFEVLIEPLKMTGIISENDLAQLKLRPSHRISVRDPSDDSVRWSNSTVAAVLPRDVLTDSGVIGRNWPSSDEWTSIRPMMASWLATNLPTTLRFDDQARQQALRDARDNVRDQYDYFNRNQVLVEPGQVIDEERLDVLHAEYDEIERSISLGQRLIRLGTNFLMILVLAVLIGYYLVRNEARLARSASQLGVYLVAIVVAIAIGRFVASGSWRGEVIPVIVTVMILAIAYDQVFAALTGFVLSLILTLSTVNDLGQFVLLMSVSATSVLPLSQVSSRSTLIKVGFLVALTYFVMSWGTGIMQTQSLAGIWTDQTLLFGSLRGAACCLAAGYLVAGSLPFIESSFGVVTDISLLELSDISHPMLQELIRRAPGTYNHSVSVATIGEAAADRIGANGLLVRVGAYFHDIGKMMKPEYFVENMSEGDKSLHKDLAPAMSTLIIIGHVKDGVELAVQHNLPQQLIDFIEQHHGTTLVQYFFHEAAKQADQQPGHRTDAEEASFRYPGPKPQSREAGVMMLADAVESASRTLSDPAPKRIESLVRKIVMERLLDNQLEDSRLTMTEVHAIEESLTKSLIAIYHGRIKYPEQRTA